MSDAITEPKVDIVYGLRQYSKGWTERQRVDLTILMDALDNHKNKEVQMVLKHLIIRMQGN